MASLLPLVGIVLIFWLLIIRPASRRQKELRTMQSSLSEGAQIVLTSGVYGTVRAVEDDHVRVEVADGVVLKVARGAIGSIQPVVEEATDPETTDPEATDPEAAALESPEPTEPETPADGDALDRDDAADTRRAEEN